MIRFQRTCPPAGFDEHVVVPGAAWLKEHPTGRPPAYWGQFRGELADAFGALCAYGAMYEPVGTVDHFVSVDDDRSQAYSWDNYRFCAAWINSSKKSLRSTRLIDPFEVVNEWFEVPGVVSAV